MRTKILVLLVTCVGCSSKEKSPEDTELTLRHPQAFAISVSSVDLLGSAVWGMAVGDGVPGSDWLRIDGKVAGPASSTSSLREIGLDIPLNLAGEWSGTNRHIAFTYEKYSDASALGVARLFQASAKAWQHPSVSGEGQAPEQESVDDDSAPPSGPNGEVPEDFIDGYERYVVRAVDLTYKSSTKSMIGTIILQPDPGQLPEVFDLGLDLVVEVEGVLSAFECRSTTGESVQESGVEVLRSAERMDSVCLSHFNLN